ncbi:MAG: STAS-like domain-containing protein [Methylophilaceae bacterium]
MSVIRQSSEDCRTFILENVEKHPSEIAKVVAKKFKISRQAANKHLQKLVKEKTLSTAGNTRSRVYSLTSHATLVKTYLLAANLAEHEIWQRDIKPALGLMPDNVLNIWDYCFTEMFNNVIDHSLAEKVTVELTKSAVATQIIILDDGVGIFKKIQTKLGLFDERHAVLELAKGKFTTDPANHSGEGIFFSSRACDSYHIFSGGVDFSHQYGRKEDWIFERTRATKGTAVIMKVKNHTARKLKRIFDEFAGDDYGFNKTVVPVRLTQYGDDALVSRSQAKRLLNRVDRFKTVMLDFKGVETIGQAFADEIFRVFVNQHPDIDLIEMNVNKDVGNMISRAKAAARSMLEKDDNGKQENLF